MAQPWENMYGLPPMGPLVSPGPIMDPVTGGITPPPPTQQPGGSRQPRIPRYPGNRPPPGPAPEWMQGYREAMDAWRAQRPDIAGGSNSKNDPAWAAWEATRPPKPQHPKPSLNGAPIRDEYHYWPGEDNRGYGGGGNFGGNSGGIMNSPAFGTIRFNTGNGWQTRNTRNTGWGPGGGQPGTSIPGTPTTPGLPGSPTTPVPDPTLVDRYDPLRRGSRFGRLGSLGSSSGFSSGSSGGSSKKAGKKAAKAAKKDAKKATTVEDIKRPGLGATPTTGTPMGGFKFPQYTQQWANSPDIFGKTYG